MARKKKKRYPKRTTSAASNGNVGRWQPTRDLRQDLNAAMAFHKKGQLQEAERLYQTIISAEPNHPDALHLMGVLLSQRGDCERAIRMIRKAIQIVPNSAILYNNLANAFAHAGRLNEALDTYQKALNLTWLSLTVFRLMIMTPVFWKRLNGRRRK